MDTLSDQARKCCTVKTLKKRLPILQWLPSYDTNCLVGDIVAGLTVGLTVLPQGLAYGIVAGLEPTYGLYSAFMGCYVYMFFGSSKDVTIGPTAIMSLMVHEYSSSGNADIATLLCFIAGIIILAAGIVNLGFLIQFISKPVIYGFTSAAAITIATSQLKSVFGISIEAEGFVQTIIEVIKHLDETRWQDLTMSIACIIVLLAMRYMKKYSVVKEDDNSRQRGWKKVISLLSVGRNALVVVVATVIAANVDPSTFIITGDITPGLPPFEPPPFHTTINGTYLGFSDIMETIGAGVFVIPMIAIIEDVAIASAFSGGKTIDATQEMIALGFCNILGSFVSSYPVTGSFSRTAVNASSGVKTTAGGVVTGTLVILALAFLTPYFKYIPKSTLAAVIICAVIFMIEYEVIVPIWKVNKWDQLTLWVTFFTCLFWKLEFGFLIGAGVNICVLLCMSSRPKLEVQSIEKSNGEGLEYIVVQPRSGIYFPSADYIQATVSKIGLKNGGATIPVVVDCCHFRGVDYSAAKCMKSLVLDFKKRKQMLFFCNVPSNVEKGLLTLNPEMKIISETQLISVVISNGGSATDHNLHLANEGNDVDNPLLAKVSP